jgi:hypothetical protein
MVQGQIQASMHPHMTSIGMPPSRKCLEEHLGGRLERSKPYPEVL